MAWSSPGPTAAMRKNENIDKIERRKQKRIPLYRRRNMHTARYPTWNFHRRPENGHPTTCSSPVRADTGHLASTEGSRGMTPRTGGARLPTRPAGTGTGLLATAVRGAVSRAGQDMNVHRCRGSRRAGQGEASGQKKYRDRRHSAFAQRRRPATSQHLIHRCFLGNTHRLSPRVSAPTRQLPIRRNACAAGAPTGPMAIAVYVQAGQGGHRCS